MKKAQAELAMRLAAALAFWHRVILAVFLNDNHNADRLIVGRDKARHQRYFIA